MDTRRLHDFLSSQSVRNSISIFVIVMMVLQVSVLAQSSSSALSREKLVALKNAGVSDSVLIQQIQKDGISFDMTADTTLELKNAGFSNDVLQALLRASSNSGTRSVQPLQDDLVKSLYRSRKFPELADALKASIKTNPSDYKSRTLLIMTLLQMKEKDAAHSEFQELLSHEKDPSAVPLIQKVKSLFDTLERDQQVKAELIASLKAYRVSDAVATVDQLPASAAQKGMLQINLDVYQGKYNSAREKFSRLLFDTYSEKEIAKKILDHISENENEYKNLESHVDVYLFSPYAASFCVSFSEPYSRGYYPDDFLALSVNDYVQTIDKLARLAPLNDNVLNLMFHAQLLTGNYEETERLGDRLLEARGKISIPFFSYDRFFKLVIDSAGKRIYTEDDQHPFRARYHTGGGVKSNQEATVNDWWSQLVPFDLRLDQITELDQKARRRRDAAEVMVSKSYALKFSPSGIAPNYALMNILYCTAGEKAEMTVTRNLGQYVLHVIGKSKVNSQLADPSTAAGPPSGWATGLLMLSGSMGQQTPLQSAATSMAIENLQAQQAQETARLQAEQATWDSITTQETFTFVEADAFTGLEQLLGVLN